MVTAVTGFKKYWFLFRYFLIGKFHCDLPQHYKRYFKLGFYTVWTIICTSVATSIREILIYIKGLVS